MATRYPTGALWILNRAKILRMTHDANGAIEILQGGLKEDEKEGKAEGTADGVAFREADTLVSLFLSLIHLSLLCIKERPKLIQHVRLAGIRTGMDVSRPAPLY